MENSNSKIAWFYDNQNIIDLLPAEPSAIPFSDRVKNLRLSSALESKLCENSQNDQQAENTSLNETDEKELGSEVLLQRHKFTEQVHSYKPFRQAALSVVQNIYLFKNRKIFFSGNHATTEEERQDALMMLSLADAKVPLAKTFQHLIIARVWKRIIEQSTEEIRNQREFIELHSIVENLNTLRNIYIVLCTKLVKQLVRNISPIYRESITSEDAEQIGNFGIARAAYRYHPSCGVRFSTYAFNWVQKEIQRQSLGNRLISLPSNLVEKYAKASKQKNEQNLEKVTSIMRVAQVKAFDQADDGTEIFPFIKNDSPAKDIEKKQIAAMLNKGVCEILSAKSADIIKRRYGLKPYKTEQSIIEIADTYNVTRSSIYQSHNLALAKLKEHISL